MFALFRRPMKRALVTIVLLSVAILVSAVALRSSFRDQEPQEWRAAMRRLARPEFDREIAVRRLSKALADADLEKRAFAGAMLLDIGSQECVPVLQKVIQAELQSGTKSPASEMALEALARHRVKIDETTLLQLAPHSPEALKIAALQGVEAARPILDAVMTQDPGRLGIYQLVRYYQDPREAEIRSLQTQVSRTDVPPSFHGMSQVWWYVLTGDLEAEKFVLDAASRYATADTGGGVDAQVGNHAFAALRDNYIVNARSTLRSVAQKPLDFEMGAQSLASLFYVYRDFSFVDERIAAALNEDASGKSLAHVALEWRIAAARNTEQLRELAQRQPALFQRYFVQEASRPIESWIFQYLGPVALSTLVATKGG